MAQVKANKFSAPRKQGVNGDAVFINDSLTVATNPAIGDTLDFIIPKGTEVSMINVYHTALAASGLAGSIGYAPVDTTSTLSAVTNYFRAAATFGLSATGFTPAFIPIVFEEDVYLRFTITATGVSFVAGTLYVTIGANQNGVR